MLLNVYFDCGGWSINHPGGKMSGNNWGCLSKNLFWSTFFRHVYVEVNWLLNAPLRQNQQKVEESLEKFQRQQLSNHHPTISAALQTASKDPKTHRLRRSDHTKSTQSCDWTTQVPELIGLRLVCGSYPQLFRHRHSGVVLNDHPFLLRG